MISKWLKFQILNAESSTVAPRSMVMVAVVCPASLNHMVPSPAAECQRPPNNTPLRSMTCSAERSNPGVLSSELTEETVAVKPAGFIK